ncbi:MAG: hypothetical protein AAB758_00505 [Patescibacteria group bacterium]
MTTRDDLPLFRTENGDLVRRICKETPQFIFHGERPRQRGYRVGDKMPAELHVEPFNDQARALVGREGTGK